MLAVKTCAECLSCCPLNNHRACLGAIHSYLQALSTTHPAILQPQEISAALQPAGFPAAAASVDTMSVGQLAAAAPALLSLVSKAAVLLVMHVLSDLIVADPAVRDNIINSEGGCTGLCRGVAPSVQAVAGNLHCRVRAG